MSIHFKGFHDASVDGTEVWVSQQASSRSRSFAQTLLDRLVLVTGVPNRGVRERNLGVLLPSRHDANTAACLVEVAFLTNPEQAARLESELYFCHIADALADAVRAQVPVAVSHGVGAGGGSGPGSEYSLSAPSLWESDPVDDERYSAGVSTEELERLYSLPLEAVVKTVVNAGARIRGGPPNFATQGQQRIPRWTKVRVEEVNGEYSRVAGLDGNAYGWTASSNLATFFKDSAALGSASLAPTTAITIDTTWPETRKAIARTFNRLGGLIQTIAGQTRTAAADILAVWQMESGGRSHTTNRAVIRLENHLLFGQWGSQHPAEFDLHFQFGTRAPQTGTDCNEAWKCHRFRQGETGSFEDSHASQDSEYRALACAETLAGETIAIQCASIGGSQILGRNYRTIGYDTPRQMYDAFQASERAHVLGFFDYCQFVQANGALLNALRTQNWRDFASGFNGASRVDRYSADLQGAAQAATAVLSTRPAGAQSLEISLASALRRPLDSSAR